jgi:hypothetical protein
MPEQVDEEAQCTHKNPAIQVSSQVVTQSGHHLNTLGQVVSHTTLGQVVIHTTLGLVTYPTLGHHLTQSDVKLCTGGHPKLDNLSAITD